jgi:hypothetical protein
MADGKASLQKTRAFLESMGLPSRDGYDLSTSTKRFPDGRAWRVEIPSVEGPAAFKAVLEAAAAHGVTVDRISQGSGIQLLTDAELSEMVKLGTERKVEVCLFVGPRAGWDIGVQASTPSGKVSGGTLRGADQLVYGIEDVKRGVEFGLRSVLVSDLGQLRVLGKMRAAGELPKDLIFKVSVALPAANPATAQLLEELGASTLNLPVDLSLPQIAAIRAAVNMPLDIYVEGPDDFGGTVRHQEIAEIARIAAPVHLKFGLRNSPAIYPAGEQLQALVLSSARERVRRAAIGLGLLRRYGGDGE